VIRACLFALDPTDAQERMFRSHSGAQRVAYNWCLARVRANWAQRAAEQTCGLIGDQLTPWINTSAYACAMRGTPPSRSWRRGGRRNSKEAHAAGCANLAAALGNRRAGRARMPRFKSKHRAQADRVHTRGRTCGASWSQDGRRRCAGWSWTATTTPHEIWPPWRPTPASCAGSCPTEAMSDRTCAHDRQSHRCGKTASAVNATSARRWLDDDVSTRLIER
jgi:hypothetical protein